MQTNGTYLVCNWGIVEHASRTISVMPLFAHVERFTGIIELPSKWSV